MPRPLATTIRRTCTLILTTAGLMLGTPGARGDDAAAPPKAAAGRVERFDVVIAGGTTAAFAAAVAAANAGARVALLEPTDWVGGQLTASGVPAVDQAWHKVKDPRSDFVLDVAAISRDRVNMTPNFRATLDATGNPGRGWVSNYCFLPEDYLARQLLPMERAAGDRLVVYRETVPKSVDADAKAGRIRSLTAIRRTPRADLPHRGYDRLLSRDLADWYRAEPSERFTKEVLTFEAPVFLEATEWGELLALADAPYLIGTDSPEGTQGDDRCGQSTVIDLVERLNAGPVAEPKHAEGVDRLGFGAYKGRPDAWAQIWTYRRLKGLGKGPTVGDLSLQNWGYSEKANEGGNDYPFGYLFLSRRDTSAQRTDWMGGIDLDVLAAAERRALAWHDWFRDNPQPPIQPGQVTLEIGALGTSHGLAKLPYIRDTRRSIGLDGFVLTMADLTGPARRMTGRRFADRIAIGAYPGDIHPMAGCVPAWSDDLPTLPFLIPFRALTNRGYSNLLTAGKTMAQGFRANAATRLHPIEWSTGTAAGVAAAHMARTGRSTREVYEHISELQPLVRAVTPIEWTIAGKTYPGTGAEVEP